ncbi:MAG: siderophore-interacting protein [Bifidobacteriaceae bacterium]|nr:siderophore-interacting protein [Bifidobacteriaceae bacterium]
MSNIAVEHAPSGLVRTSVVAREAISPHVVRVTLGGGDLPLFEFKGFDQWFRLAIPVHDADRFDNLPSTFALGGYLRYLALPKATRPEIRNYTARAWRASPARLDIDFLQHGDHGVAGPWAATVEPGAEVALIDQGCGWKDPGADWRLLAGDETAMPAIAGILRDMPRDAVGHAFIELFDARDRQPLDAPDAVRVHWLERSPGAAPGDALLPAVRALEFPPGRVYAFAAGESAIAAGVRRHLVSERDVPKNDVTFCSYWKRSATVHA